MVNERRQPEATFDRRRSRRFAATAFVVAGLPFMGVLAAADWIVNRQLPVSLPANEAPELAWERTDSFPAKQLTDAVWTGDRFIVAGHDDGGRGAVWSSPDGTNWTPAEVLSELRQEGATFDLWAHDGTVLAWITQGKGPPFEATLLRSTDGGEAFAEQPGLTERLRQLMDDEDREFSITGAASVEDTVIVAVGQSVWSPGGLDGTTSLVVSVDDKPFKFVDLGAVDLDDKLTVSDDGMFVAIANFSQGAALQIPGQATPLGDAVGRVDSEGSSRAVITSNNGNEWKAGVGLPDDVTPVSELDETLALQKKLLIRLQDGDWEPVLIHPGLRTLDVGDGGFFGSVTADGQIPGTSSPIYGWSPDGINWNWQHVTDHFELADGESPGASQDGRPVRFVIGGKTALAIVELADGQGQQGFRAQLP